MIQQLYLASTWHRKFWKFIVYDEHVAEVKVHEMISNKWKQLNKQWIINEITTDVMMALSGQAAKHISCSKNGDRQTCEGFWDHAELEAAWQMQPMWDWVAVCN